MSIALGRCNSIQNLKEPLANLRVPVTLEHSELQDI